MTTDERAHCAFTGTRTKRDGKGIINQFLAALSERQVPPVMIRHANFQFSVALKLCKFLAVKRSIEKISVISFFINKQF